MGNIGEGGRLISLISIIISCFALFGNAKHRCLNVSFIVLLPSRRESGRSGLEIFDIFTDLSLLSSINSTL
uniref:Putative secreted peptide n=1 Tax=Anopheles braziliensis TaxID=58242 RepID=A0A2M3ZXK3_9DIPT